jgi:putative spermidine/putrescine transport system ATP-binding protein
MARLRLSNLSKRYGDQTAVAGVTLDVADGEFLVLLGPSGCGKTTTLRRKLAKADIASRVKEVLRLVRLEVYAERYPRQLSGGQQQRVALARALAVRPDVLLLDEPLSNLDAKLREEVRIEIRELQRQLGLTAIMVTHDQEEALTVADRLVVMAEGEIRQIGSQRDLYENPADQFVANFVGRSTFLVGRVTAPGQFETAGGLHLKCPEAAATGPAALALRPERLSLSANGMDNHLPGHVEFVSYLGAVLELRVRLSPHDRVAIQLPNRRDALPNVGDAVEIGWQRHAGMVFAQQ